MTSKHYSHRSTFPHHIIAQHQVGTERRDLSFTSVKNMAEPIRILTGSLKMESCCKQSMVPSPNSSLQSFSSVFPIFLNQLLDHHWAVPSQTAHTGSRTKKARIERQCLGKLEKDEEQWGRFLQNADQPQNSVIYYFCSNWTLTIRLVCDNCAKK